MDSDRLTHMQDVTRRYGKYRPCGAGLGVLWGGFLLGALGLMLLQWAWHEHAVHATASQTLWRFLRDTRLTPPGWLQLAAVISPFVAWLGLVLIQQWVDGRFGAVTLADTTSECAPWRPRGPQWLPPVMVVVLACVLVGIMIWDGQAFSRGVPALMAIAAWTLVWGRASRDRLTLLVMFAVSVPSLYVIASTDPDANFTAGNLLIFATYLLLMIVLIVQGLTRFRGFLRVSAELSTLRPAE
jgi:hypothetical protein